MAISYKICPAPLWREAERVGTFGGAPVDLSDGFIHLSTAGQVAETAARHFAGAADLLLVAVRNEDLGEALRFEPSRGGAFFPHLHGALSPSLALSVVPLPLGPDGRHVFPPEILAAAGRFEPEAAGWRPMRDDSFIRLVGPLWTRVVADPGRDGERRYGFLAEARHLNRGGVVHGGMLMTFADQALGLAAWAANGDRPQVTIQLDTHFVSSAQEGEFVEARGRVVRHARSIMFLAGELFVGDRIVATAAGVWKLREARTA